MISAVEIQTTYNKLYALIREYIWDFKTVQALAGLEIAVYRRFPDLTEIRSLLSALKRLVSNYGVLQEDADLSDAFDYLGELIESNPDIYSKLNTFKEVLV